MNLKKCEKCSELVDPAKAFCPGCGNPFVAEEKREDSSEFDKYAGTMNMTKSAYNMMLSEMDLNTSRPTEKEVKLQKIEPLPDPPKKIPPATAPPPQTGNSGKYKWVILAVVGMVILIPLAAILYLFLFTGIG